MHTGRNAKEDKQGDEVDGECVLELLLLHCFCHEEHHEGDGEVEEVEYAWDYEGEDPGGVRGAGDSGEGVAVVDIHSSDFGGELHL
jgi:hypothetical protein